MASRSRRDARLAGASRADVDGWIHCRIHGKPGRRGYQHGALLGPEIREALRTIRFLVKQDTGVPFSFFCKHARRMFEPLLASNGNGLLPDGSGVEILEELQGIVDGANAHRESDDVEITLEDILGWNGYPELLCQWWPAVLAGQIEGVRPPSGAHPGPHAGRHHRFTHSCSAFVATGRWTADGGVVAAQTTWQCFANGDAYNLILDVAPAQGHRILMQSVPGYVASSTDFWVTAAGLIVTETSINGIGFDPSGLPEFFRARRAAQYADSIDDWHELFRTGNNGGYTNSWLLADAHTGEIACCELTLQHDVLRKKTSGAFPGFNIPLDVRVRKLDVSQPAGWDNVLQSGARRVRWETLLAEHKGSIDLSTAETFLADHHDVYLDADMPSSRTICGHIDNDDGHLSGHGPAPWYPWGSLDGKAATGAMALDMRLSARWGRACGTPFEADAFYVKHPQYAWLRGYMKDRPTQPWVIFGDPD